MRITTWAIMTMTTVALAGCVTEAPAAGEVEIASLSDIASPSFSGCHLLTTTMDYANGQGPGQRPNHWSEEGGLIDGHQLILLTCHRIGIGTLERGPATILFDTSHRFSAPSPCRTAGATAALIDSISWSDESLANHGREAWGATSHDIIVDSAGAVNDQGNPNWKWALRTDESDIGALEYHQLEFQENDQSQHLKLYWDHGEGVSYLQLNLEWLGPQYVLSTATGQVPSYTMHAHASDWFGAANWVSLDSIRAELHEFGDYRCESPRS